MNRPWHPVLAGDRCLHRVGVPGAEVEDLSHLDAAGVDAFIRWHFTLEPDRVMDVLGCRVGGGPLPNDRSKVALVIDVRAGNFKIEQVLVAEHSRFPSVRKDDEFMRQIASDGSGLGTHRNGLEAHTRKGAQISNEHLVVRQPRRGFVDVEGVSILHEELAPAHHAEARAYLVAKLSLDVIKYFRQLTIGMNIGSKNLGDHLLVGWPIQHIATMLILDAQHLRTVGIVAASLAPKFSELQ